MLFNVSYNNPKITAQINELVGKPYSLWQSIKMGGNGSPRLVINKSSSEISKILDSNNSINYSNIELRPKGIIIGFRANLDAYALVIPYYKLVVYRPNHCYTFYIDHHFIGFENPKKKNVKTFFDKVIQQKIENTLPSVDEL